MKNKKFLIIRIILAVLISTILGFGVYMWNAQTIMGNSLPMPLGFGIAEVLTDSTTDPAHPETSIYRGDVIVVVPQDEYEVGDVVAFQSENIVVTHRIIEINEDGEFITKGDSPENTPDTDPLKKEYVFGKVVKVIPNLSGVIRFIKTPTVSMIILLAASLLFVLSMKKEKAQEEDELSKIKSEIAKLKNSDNERSAEDIQAEIDALKKQVGEKDKK